MRDLGVVVLALALSAGFSCRRVGDSTAERVLEDTIRSQGREASVRIDRSSRSLTIELGGVAAPADWPSDVPLYPGLLAARARRHPDGSVKLSVSSSDAPDRLFRFYWEALSAQGWRTEGSGDGFRARRGSRFLEGRFRPAPPGSKGELRLFERG